MTTRRRFQILLATGACMLCAAPVASAATVEHTRSDGQDQLEFRAGKREQNKLTVTVGTSSITFKDPNAKLSRKKGDLGGCRFTTRKAVCKVDPTADIVVHLGDGNDSVGFKGDLKTPLGGTDTSQATDVGLLDEETDGDGFISRTRLYGGKGNDRITGTRLGDVVDGGAGKDTVDTGDSEDFLVDTQDGVADIYRGGDGFDVVDVRGDEAVVIDLGLELITAGSEMTSLDSFERAHGGEGNDTLIGSDGADGLFGEEGSDTLDGRGGADLLDCGTEADGVTSAPEDVVRSNCETG